MKKYDSESLGVLKYSDFCEAIFPKDPYYLNVLTSRKCRLSLCNYFDNKDINELFT